MSPKCCVTVVSIVALLAGCFSAERKKNIKESKTLINKESDKSEKNKSKKSIASSSNGFNLSSSLPHRYSFDDNPGIPPVDSNGAITTSAKSSHFFTNYDHVRETSSLFGEVKVNFPLMDKKLSSPSLDFLLPLKKSENELLFTQIGMRRHENRTIFNLGFGQRHFFDQWMFGYNAFYDTQLTGSSHQRLGLGLELWADNVKFSANSYHRLSGWKAPDSNKNGKERVANGYDLTMEAYLPSYPQLGGRLKFENYFGSNVAASKNSKQNNPAAMTLGMNYSPVPLFMFGVDHSHWFNDRSEAKFNLSFNYQFNVPLSRQLDPHYLPARKSLSGSRMNLVERNNNITLEHKDNDHDFISLQLPSEIVGYENDIQDIQLQVTAKFGLSHIVWNEGSIGSLGGKVIKQSANSYQVQLPRFVKDSNNQYTISAVAHDRKGHVSPAAQIVILTKPKRIVSPVTLDGAANSSPEKNSTHYRATNSEPQQHQPQDSADQQDEANIESSPMAAPAALDSQQADEVEDNEASAEMPSLAALPEQNLHQTPATPAANENESDLAQPSVEPLTGQQSQQLQAAPLDDSFSQELTELLSVQKENVESHENVIIRPKSMPGSMNASPQQDEQSRLNNPNTQSLPPPPPPPPAFSTSLDSTKRPISIGKPQGSQNSRNSFKSDSDTGLNITPEILKDVKLRKTKKSDNSENHIHRDNPAISGMRDRIGYDQKATEEHRRSEASNSTFDNDDSHQPINRTDSGIDSVHSSLRSSLSSPPPSPETLPLAQSSETNKLYNVVDLNTNSASSCAPTNDLKAALKKRRLASALSDRSDSSDDGE